MTHYYNIAPHNRPFGPHAVGSRFRMYIDEVGHHRRAAPGEDIPSQRYLGLVGIVIEETVGRPALQSALDRLRADHFPEAMAEEDPPVIHLTEIRKKQGAFTVLNDPERRRAFHTDTIRLVEQAEFISVTAVVDKSSHFSKPYRSRRDPYHYALEILIERYVGLLNMCEGTGDVMTEARDKEADQQLAVEFETIRTEGTRYHSSDDINSALSSSRLKVKPKWKNIAGLQLADLVAHPLWRQVLEQKGRLQADRDALRNRIRAAANPKRNRQMFTGEVEGYGEKFLD